MDGEETRTDRFGAQLRSAQLAARRIEAGDINPFALPAGVSANVNEEFFRVARRLRCFRAQVCPAAKEHRERGMVVSIDTAEGPLRVLASPIRFSDSSAEYNAPPRLHEHTDDLSALEQQDA